MLIIDELVVAIPSITTVPAPVIAFVLLLTIEVFAIVIVVPDPIDTAEALPDVTVHRINELVTDVPAVVTQVVLERTPKLKIELLAKKEPVLEVEKATAASE